MSGECAFCPAPNVFTNGGFSCQKPYRENEEREAIDDEYDVRAVCDQCVRELVAAWAREYKRRNMPVVTPDPTNSPAGAGTAYVERLAAVA